MLELLVHAVTNFISAWGYGGVALLMFFESANIPIPSEAIMPFAGFVASRGALSLLGVAIIGALGNWAGSSFSWWIGRQYGKLFVQRFGKYVLLNERHLEQSEKWFAQYGEASVFFGRLLPVVRTFISLPAGFAKMNYWRFSLYTILGAFPFCYLLAWLGFRLGEHWEDLHRYFRYLDILIVLIIIAAVIGMIMRRKRGVRN